MQICIDAPKTDFLCARPLKVVFPQKPITQMLPLEERDEQIPVMI